MGREAEADERRLVFTPYQVTQALVDSAASDVIVMHCLPAHRGQEIDAEVIDGPASVAFDQAENRLYAQQAVILRLLQRSRGWGAKSARQPVVAARRVAVGS
jgi:ornithine carbamoyltransferase